MVGEEPELFKIWHFCLLFSRWRHSKHGSERVKPAVVWIIVIVNSDTAVYIVVFVCVCVCVRA